MPAPEVLVPRTLEVLGEVQSHHMSHVLVHGPRLPFQGQVGRALDDGMPVFMAVDVRRHRARGHADLGAPHRVPSGATAVGMMDIDDDLDLLVIVIP